jgi:AraC-like DNA-binding protein
MFRSGFNYKSYFYKEFAEIYHMSPKEYRENNKASV